MQVKSNYSELTQRRIHTDSDWEFEFQRSISSFGVQGQEVLRHPEYIFRPAK